MTLKIAAQVRDSLHHCVDATTGERMTVQDAQLAGYTIKGVNYPVSTAKPSRPTAVQPIRLPPTYAQQIRALPEALHRPAAAAALAADNNINTLSITAASSLLRGLPTESEGSSEMSDATNATQLTAADHAMFKRKLDLRMSALRTSSQYDDGAASIELKKLNYASRTVEVTGISWGAALTMAGLDARGTITKILNGSR